MTPRVVDVGEIRARWNGPRRVFLVPDDDGEGRLAPSKARHKLLKLLKTPKTIPQLAEATGRKPEALSKALNKMQANGLVRLTGERGEGKGRPKLWIAVEVQG